MNIKSLTFISSLYLISSLAMASDAVRFFPKELQQDNKVTLSPGFSPDGNTLYFAQSECTPIWECPQRLKTSSFVNGAWTKPELMDLPVDARADWPAVTPDGKTLIFSWSAPRAIYQNLEIRENFDLYTLDLTNPDAVPIAIKGSDINRPRSGSVKTLRFVHNETLASITLDGDLYFMTERLDGIGERDIYYAKARPDDSFENAYPLAQPINSKERDDGVWVNPQGNVMLLAYPNRGGEGGSDIFISYKKDDVWTKPINLGSDINSKYADFAARFTPDYSTVVFTSDRPFGDKGAGLLQIWSAPTPASLKSDILTLVK